MNHCGEKFHNEVAKFRFLNELIKVLFPKYLGAWATEKVKGRVIEILFSWTVWFPEDIKIRDAYQMLKKQGLTSAFMSPVFTVVLCFRVQGLHSFDWSEAHCV